MGEQTPERVMRDPDETDDLPAIVRYHGGNDVIDALLTVAAEAYGPDRAVEKLHLLLLDRAARCHHPTQPDGGDIHG